jgi:hypothetical protein
MKFSFFFFGDLHWIYIYINCRLRTKPEMETKIQFKLLIFVFTHVVIKEMDGCEPQGFADHSVNTTLHSGHGL